MSGASARRVSNARVSAIIRYSYMFITEYLFGALWGAHIGRCVAPIMGAVWRPPVALCGAHRRYFQRETEAPIAGFNAPDEAPFFQAR